MIDPLDLLRSVVTLATAIILGCGVLNWYTRDAHLTKGGALWRARAVVLILVAASVGVIADALGVIGAASAAAAAADSHAFSFSGPLIEAYLVQTGVGHIVTLHFVAGLTGLALALAAWMMLEKTSLSDKLLLAAAVTAAFGQAALPFASHPTTLDPRWLGLLSSIAHRLALCAWLGGLPALILLIGVGTVTEDTRPFAPQILRRFSNVAKVAMVIILITGAVLTWYLVGNVPAMIGTVYGNLLSLKLALLAGVLFIANGLQAKLLPALEVKASDSVLFSYARRVKIETVMAVLIVFIASVMAGLSPPAHEDIVWPLHFRFSIVATLGKGTPWWMWALVVSGSLLILTGPILMALSVWPGLLPRQLISRLRPNYLLWAGAATVASGCALAMPPISVPAFPSTYQTTDIPYAATSIAAGLKHYEDNCTACHGTSGHGDGPAGAGLPVKPADLSAPHTALHTPGDLFWWISHGIPTSGMPAFADVLTQDDRWDIINFLGAFAVGYQARVIEPKIQPRQYWLGPPDFQISDESGKITLLSDYRGKASVLVALLSCTPESAQEDRTRLEQLLGARERLASLDTKIVLVAPGQECDALRSLANAKILLADEHQVDDIAATFGLFTRSFHNRQQDVVRVPKMHAEFLIDRWGYVRARWLPAEDNSWSDPATIEAQIDLLSREPPEPPPPDVHSQH
ncbi:MAG TPA: CopD family protein [Methylocella sp.]|nr:CopD family protein [Methylocella sp.]